VFGQSKTLQLTITKAVLRELKNKLASTVREEEVKVKWENTQSLPKSISTKLDNINDPTSNKTMRSEKQVQLY
jgi:hypothetical protein